MTSTASTAAPTLTPQIVGQAEKAHKPLLDRGGADGHLRADHRRPTEGSAR
jgi:hypothetical protein